MTSLDPLNERAQLAALSTNAARALVISNRKGPKVGDKSTPRVTFGKYRTFGVYRPAKNSNIDFMAKHGTPC